MVTPVSFASLTALNQRLVADASQPDPTSTDTYVGTGTGIQTVQIAKSTEPPTFTSFSSANRLEFERAVEWIQLNVFAGQPSGMDTLIDAFVNDWAVKWRADKGLSDTDFSTPTIAALIGDDRFINGAMWMPLTTTASTPPVFNSSATRTAEDGTTTDIPLIGISDPLEGITFIETTPQTVGPLKTVISQLVRAGTSNMAESARVAATVAGRVKEPLDRFLSKRALVPGTPLSEGPFPQADVLPTISQDDLVNQLVARTTTTTGSGAAARDIEFDRNQMIEQVNQTWGSWYLQNAPEQAVADIVDSYIREAKAFWVGKGGRLDFDSYVRGKLRDQPRYQTQFRDKPPEMSEEQHIGRFYNPIAQLGLRPDLTTSQSQAAVTSRGSPSEQLKRVSRTPEAQQTGGFSQRLAQTVGGLGAGARA